MTTLKTQACRQPHPGGFDSVDFYTRNGHALHARAAKEGLGLIWRTLRGLIQR